MTDCLESTRTELSAGVGDWGPTRTDNNGRKSMDAKELAAILFSDDTSRERNDGIPVMPDGRRAYRYWVSASVDAGDDDTLGDLSSVSEDDFASEWEALVAIRK
jgi:hypothetical protein